MVDVIKKLRILLSRRDKKILGFLFLASIFVSFLEMISVSLVMVFASVATNFDLILKNKYYSFLYRFLGSDSPANFVILFGLLLVVFYLFRAIILTAFTYSMSRFSQGRYKYFSVKFFKNYLNFEYKEFVSKNSANIGKIILHDTGELTAVFDSMLQIASESLNVLFIYSALLLVHWKMTLVLTVILSVKVALIVVFFSGRLKILGKNRHNLNIIMSKTYNESFWNFKLIKLSSIKEVVSSKFNQAASSLVKLTTFNSVLQLAPRLILETIGFSTLIVIIVYFVYMYKDANAIIPMISMYALAFYRFLPAINKILVSYNQINFKKQSLDSVMEYLDLEKEFLGNSVIEFNKYISFEDLSFNYNDKSKILKNVNFKIPKGQRIAFIGESGAGKSTIVDLVLGLYKPTSGNIFIDGEKLSSENIKSWRLKIGYIPQQVYLFDGTVSDNIVFGREFKESKVIEVLRKANIYEFLLKNDGINTLVGEGGILFSGGQKQRIAIARALYSDPELLVLDEATSALDNKTEAKIMDEIYRLNNDKTIIIIAHRLSTIERCNLIYKIDNSNVYLVDDLYSRTKTLTVDKYHQGQV